MTDIEKKALALVNEVADGYHDVTSIYDIHTAKALRSALCRAIEAHEAYKREVSDEVERWFASGGCGPIKGLVRFILPKPVDPLVEVVAGCPRLATLDYVGGAAELRAALTARGLEIKEKE